MKRKLAMALLTLTLSLCSILGLTACGHEHSYITSVTAPTCTEQGYTTYTCSCGDSYVDDYVDALDHDFKDYVSDNNATYEEDGTKTATCSRLGCNEKHTIKDIGTKLESGIAFTTLNVNGKNVYGKVSNSVEKFYFADEIYLSGNANFVVSLDEDGVQSSITKSMPLVEGDNTFYVLETINGVYNQTYIITIHRNYMFTVTFNTNGGTAVDSQIIEEDSFATAPNSPTKTGYIFDSWDYDFTTPITKNTEINVNWTARDDTPYKVQYYLQNLADDEYTLIETITATGVTDTDTITAEVKIFDHFTYNQSKSILRDNINGNGSTVLKVYYTRDKYSVSLNTDNSKAGSVAGSGTYKYEKEITVKATTNAGYTFLGWYEGETCVCATEEFIFKVEKAVAYVAKFEVKEEMANFNFTSTSTSCSITSIKDKTKTEVVVPDYVTEISQGAFDGCKSLTKVNYTGTIDQWVQISFSYYTSNPLGYAENLYINGELVTQANITTATEINAYAFYHCTSLTSVVIGDSVTSIGSSAFSACYKLVEVINKSSHITIEKGSSSNGGVGGYALAVYNSGDTFTGTKLSNDNGYIIYTEGNEKILVGYSGTKTKLVLPTYITKINKNAFSNCDSLTSIEIPNSVTSIGSYAFSSSSLTSVVIGDSVTCIGNMAFYNCTSLTSVEIGNSVKSIGEGAFSGCTSLTSIRFNGTVAEWMAISKGSMWDYYVPATEVTCTDGTVAI